MSSRIAKFFGRKGTRSDFSDRTLPPAPEAQVHVENSDKTKGIKKAEEIEAKVNDDVDKKDNEAAGGPVAAPKSKVQVKDNIAKDRDIERPQPSGEVYSRLWAKYLKFRAHPAEFERDSTFVPNGRFLMEVGSIMVRLVGQSNWVDKHEPTFNPYAALTGLGYLYYIQILRARERAGALTGYERSTLTRFTKAIPLEEIDIPEPLIPYFSSIVATQFEDQKYSWLVPSYGDLTAFDHMQNLGSHGAVNLIRPMIPLMLGNLANFATMSRTDMDDRIDDDTLQFTPFEWNAAAAQHFFNADHNMTAGQNTTDILAVFTSCGFSQPFEFYNDNRLEAWRAIKRSKFIDTTGVNFRLTAGGNFEGTTILEDSDFSTIDKFLVLDRSKNARWANYLFDQVRIVAKHFPNGKNLSQIPTTGGLESAILCQMRTEEARATGAGNAAANRYLYPDHKLTHTTVDNIKFYDTAPLNGMTGYFSTSRADVEENEWLMAFSIAINATPPIYAHGNSVFRTGPFFSQVTSATTEDQHNAINYAEVGHRENTIKGDVPLYQGLEFAYVRPAFKPKPSNV